MKSQNLPDIAAMRMTYLMYYVAWIYALDPIHGILNLILLISRDAIHMVVCRYTHRSVAFLYLGD